MAKANNSLLDLEEMDEKELDKVRDRYEGMAAQARKEGVTYDSTITDGTTDTDGGKAA
jgi:low affinity Fe/Cu permease